MEFKKTSFYGNVHVGLYLCATEKFVFYPKGSPEKFVDAVSVFGCEAHPAGVSESGLLGLYVCANSYGAVLPKSSSLEERAVFKRLGLNVHVCKDKWNAAGNNVCANDFGAVVNSRMPASEIKAISDCLGVPVEKCVLAGYESVGSLCVATNKGFLAGSDINEKEFSLLEGALKVPGTIGTVNMGVGFVRIGLSANSRGCVFGEATSGHELSRIHEAFSGNNGQ